MDFLTLAKTRYSVRKYKPQQIEPEKLDQILEAAHVAPTAAHRDPVRLLVIQSEEGLAKLEKAANVYGAPTVVIACTDHTKVWTRPYDGKQTADIDAAILTDHMMLQAAELGIGSVWICRFDQRIIREAFHIPLELEPINILALGYADCEPADPERHAQKRIPKSELVVSESF